MNTLLSDGSYIRRSHYYYWNPATIDRKRISNERFINDGPKLWVGGKEKSPGPKQNRKMNILDNIVWRLRLFPLIVRRRP